MLNREMIVKEFNKTMGKRVRVDAPDVIEGFLDLEMDGVSEEMLLDVIREGLIEDKSELLNPQLVKIAYEGMKEREVKQGEEKQVEVKEIDAAEETPEFPPEETRPRLTVPDKGLFGSFERGIMDVVCALVEQGLYPALDAKFDAYLKDNPTKIQKRIEYIGKDGRVTKGIQHECFEDVEIVVEDGEPCMLIGPAGTGKNFLAKQIAEHLGLEFYFANAVQQVYTLTGFIDANGVYHETQFFKAFTTGGVFLFDEIDASIPEVMVTFNAALENGYMDFPIGRFYAHKNFRVIAAANTWGTGASYQYVGRNKLDDATLDRFTPIEINYDKAIEDSITDDKELLEFIREFRKHCEKIGIYHVVSYRAIRRCSKFAAAFGKFKALKMGLVKSMEKDDMNMLYQKFSESTNTWAKAFCDIARG